MHTAITRRAMIALLLADGSALGAPVTFKGSFSTQERENLQADADGLVRFDELTLEHFKKRGLLVQVFASEALIIDKRLPEKYRWCLPYVRDFLGSFSTKFFEEFGKPLQLNSAVRSTRYQQELEGTNANAASHLPGPRQSSHLTGATVDIAKLGRSRNELLWMHGYLAALQQVGYVAVTEEFFQAVFHIMVFKKYKEAR